MKTTQENFFSRLPLPVLLGLPVALLVGVIALFLATGGGLDFEAPAPVEALTVERAILTRNHIELVVRNSSPEPIHIAQVVINEGVRPFSMQDYTIPRLASASIDIPYGWVEGEAYEIVIFSGNAIAFDHEIAVATETARLSPQSLLGFTLIGLYVGVIPVFLGILWFPALRSLDRRWFVFLMAATIGLLIFLGVDTLVEAVEQAELVAASFQGLGLVSIGAVGIFLLLAAISAREERIERDASRKRLSVAFTIALGIGLHNLGEGLAIGAAYNVGEIALGTFLVVGFIIQNITEGLGIIAPILRDRPALRHLIWLGLIGGAPAIAGAWMGAYAPSALFAALFLGIGAGAIFEVAYEIGKLLRKEKDLDSVMVFWGVLAGMMLLWITGLLIK